MIPVRLSIRVICSDGQMTLVRDVKVPVLVPGMYLTGIFGPGRIGMEVARIECQVAEGLLTAELEPPESGAVAWLETPRPTKEDVLASSTYGGWRRER